MMNERQIGKTAKELIKDVLDKVYADAWDAKSRGEPVGWSSSKFPSEIAEALGLSVVYPENQAAAITAKHGGGRLCEIAEGLGFCNDICGYARISLAVASGAEAVERPMPLPDFLLCCNNMCNCMIKWYENIARMHDIPMILVDVPYNNNSEIDDETVRYVLAQFDDATRKLEKIAGKVLDIGSFEEVCRNANDTAKAWLKVISYCRYTPSPFSGFELFNHMAVVVTARVKKESAQALEKLAEELQACIDNGATTLAFEEHYRIMFDGIPCWPKLSDLLRPLKKHGMNTTAVVYAPAFSFTYNNMEEMARAYCTTPNTICTEAGVKWREDMCRENAVDGILVNYNRSCKPWSGPMPAIGRRLEKNLDIPVVGFDGDQADPRNFSTEQYTTRIEGFHELLENQ